MVNEFSGKTALVTGASRGIGAATAIALARAGVRRIVIHYNSYREGAEKILEDVRAAGAEADSMQADLSRVAGIEAFVASILEKAPETDILINNAGSLVRRAPLADCTPETYDEVMNLNVKSVWRITQAVAPHMISRRGGVIVNVSSIAARTGGGPGATVYAAAKAAVSAMTRGTGEGIGAKGNPGERDQPRHG